MKTKHSEIGCRGEIETVVARRAETPVLDPGQPVRIVESGFTKRASAFLFAKVKLLSGNVRDCEVRELQIVDDKP